MQVNIRQSQILLRGGGGEESPVCFRFRGDWTELMFRKLNTWKRRRNDDVPVEILVPVLDVFEIY